MTNINCATNCIYQKDGKCTFDKTSSTVITPNSGCAYYSSKNNM